MKNKFNIGDVVEVSTTGEIVGIDRNVSGTIIYQLRIENENKKFIAYINVPESEIVHTVPDEPDNDFLYEQECEDKRAS